MDHHHQESELDQLDVQPEIKAEPTLQCYVENENVNGSINVSSAPSNGEGGNFSLWTSKATTCLIQQYKKYRSMVGQTTQIRSLREMFEMISLEMQNRGFFFSPQKCENKWRVLERKYKNLMHRERLKKPGRMRHYGHWEHKRAMDEIFNEKKKQEYLNEVDLPVPSGPSRYSLNLRRNTNENSLNNTSTGLQQSHPIPPREVSPVERNEKTSENNKELIEVFQTFLNEFQKKFAESEQNKERRHKEKMAIRQNELEIKKRLLTIEEEKIELQKRQILAAAQHLHLSL
ncbi:uncharacterized protein [Prorops nasuta]|uniref:uncharacterized protein n=1 Tax=Prorops nasuta TaxID=863751 RepID=UPI0034CFC0A9